MAFSPHVRVSALGRIGTPEVDRFSYGFCLSPQDGFITLGDWAGITALQWTDIADSVSNFHADDRALISSRAVLEVVKFAAIGADGKYMADPIMRSYTTPGAVTDNTTILPQSALAISLGTNRRGPTGKGRFYVPMPMVAISEADGFRFTMAIADDVRDCASEMLNDINNAPGLDVFTGGARVVIASTKGYNTAVTSVRVGRVVDTIRSRRNKLVEGYTTDADVS